MLYKSVQSSTSYKLYIVAAVLMFIAAASYAIFYYDQPVAMDATLTGILGVLFIIGGLFAKYGVGIAGRTERHVGGGYYRSTVETADACICGITTGFATIVTRVTSDFLLFASVPGFLGGVVAIIAGIVAFRKQVGEGEYARPQVPTDSITCPYCHKTGISPQAKSCPNCGQPLAD